MTYHRDDNGVWRVKEPEHLLEPIFPFLPVFSYYTLSRKYLNYQLNLALPIWSNNRDYGYVWIKANSQEDLVQISVLTVIQNSPEPHIACRKGGGRLPPFGVKS